MQRNFARHHIDRSIDLACTRGCSRSPSGRMCMIRSVQKPMSCSATCPKQPINALNLTLNGHKRPTNALNLLSDWARSASILAELGVKPSSATAKAAGHWPATFRAQKPGEAPNSTRFLPLFRVGGGQNDDFRALSEPQMPPPPRNALKRPGPPPCAGAPKGLRLLGVPRDRCLA